MGFCFLIYVPDDDDDDMYGSRDGVQKDSPLFPISKISDRASEFLKRRSIFPRPKKNSPPVKRFHRAAYPAVFVFWSCHSSHSAFYEN